MSISFTTESNEVATPIEADSGPNAMDSTEQEWELIQQKVEDGQAITFSELVALSNIPPFDMRTMLAPKARILFVQTLMRNLEDLEARNYITINTPLKIGEDGMWDAESPPSPPEEYQAMMMYVRMDRVPTPQWAMEYEVRELKAELSNILKSRGPVSHSAWAALERKLASPDTGTCFDVDSVVESAMDRENDDWNLILRTKPYTILPPSALALDDRYLRGVVAAMLRLCGVPDELATRYASPEQVDATIRRYLEPHVQNSNYTINIRLFSCYLHQRMDAEFKQHRDFQRCHMRAIRALETFQARKLFNRLYRVDYPCSDWSDE
ncbi:uncharacterized protein TRIREDRAFT_111289 [Trichoderma reesei QM6a]|jgi:hypothetical protein|uniref:Predicted protein n=2 Tax=Hypocrea jecorina TaxID=51453 RepID=G0RU10_HYPJQ|nr:uncharacterized protein TRIREDRAFT_111289 [Trichoderma reesei QM6a]EGR45367.1 predicted protein [Trichoderma reesei QM6a]ETR98024.1 hypothetical protein M419DRAFT_12117 [Trichoderma reesei RUT C-30]